jgi:hypothetical protein
MSETIIPRFDRELLEKWSFLSTVFRIATRDYRRALNANTYMDYQLTVIQRTVSDMLDLQADFKKSDRECPPLIAGEGCWPVIALEEWKDVAWLEAAWEAAAVWVRQLKQGSLARESLSAEYIRNANDSRTFAVRSLQAIIKDAPVESAPTPLDFADEGAEADAPTLLQNV